MEAIRPMYSIEDTTPSDFNPGDRSNFSRTCWGGTDAEMTARNVLVLQRYTGFNKPIDGKLSWRPFTWSDYQIFCSHPVSDDEEVFLDLMVEEHFLTFDPESGYSVTPAYIAQLPRHIKTAP